MHRRLAIAAAMIGGAQAQVSKAIICSEPARFIYGDKGKNIPPQAFAFMAARAKSRETVVVNGGSHVVMVSNPSAARE